MTHNEMLEKETIRVHKDEWRHRSEGMKCGTCIWFVLKEKQSDMPRPMHAKEIGRCRRHAPTINGYPATYLNDWCGDHRIDENKI